jgi:hypothetical protein
VSEGGLAGRWAEQASEANSRQVSEKIKKRFTKLTLIIYQRR